MSSSNPPWEDVTDGNTHMERWPLKDLMELSEAAFHPPLNEKRVAVMAENFDLDLFEPPTIAPHTGKDSDGEDVNGASVICEGRHRTHAAYRSSIMDPGMEVWVRVVVNREAADLYEELNTGRRKPSNVEIFNSRVDRAVPRVREGKIKEIAEGAGYTIGGKGAKGIWHIDATRSCTIAYDQYGEDNLRTTLEILAQVTHRRMGATDRENTWGSAKCIQAVSYLLKVYEDLIDTDRLVNALAKVSPHVACPVNANSAGRNGYTVATLYNKEIRGPGAEKRKLNLRKIPLRFQPAESAAAGRKSASPGSPEVSPDLIQAVLKALRDQEDDE